MLQQKLAAGPLKNENISDINSLIDKIKNKFKNKRSKKKVRKIKVKFKEINFK